MSFALFDAPRSASLIAHPRHDDGCYGCGALRALGARVRVSPA